MYTIVTHPSPASPTRTIVEVVSGKNRVVKHCQCTPTAKIGGAIKEILSKITGEAELIEWTTAGAGATKSCSIKGHLHRSRDNVVTDILAKKAEASKKRTAAKAELDAEAAKAARAAARAANAAPAPKAPKAPRAPKTAAAPAAAPVAGLPVPGASKGKGKGKGAGTAAAAPAASGESKKKNKGAAAYQRWIKSWRKNNPGKTHADAIAAYTAQKPS